MNKPFTDIVSAQGWNDETQLIHALGFIEMRGLHDDFTAYAQACADEENRAAAECVILDELPTECECDNTHEQNNTVCRYCWAKGLRHPGDAAV